MKKFSRSHENRDTNSGLTAKDRTAISIAARPDYVAEPETIPLSELGADSKGRPLSPEARFTKRTGVKHTSTLRAK